MEFYKIRILALAEKILRYASFDPNFSCWEQDVCRVDLHQLKENTYYFEDIIEDARTFGRGSRLRASWWRQIVNILKFYYHEKSAFWWM